MNQSRDNGEPATAVGGKNAGPREALRVLNLGRRMKFLNASINARKVYSKHWRRIHRKRTMMGRVDEALAIERKAMLAVARAARAIAKPARSSHYAARCVALDRGERTMRAKLARLDEAEKRDGLTSEQRVAAKDYMEQAKARAK